MSELREMSAEVRHDNPYSRLMALQKMGVVENYERIRSKTITIIGLGGIGSVAAEMLTRCGIGSLLLFDYDSVELSNMNRLFFRPCHVGLTKPDAAIATLREINPDVQMEAFHGNVTVGQSYDDLEAACARSDLLLCCVDNYAARGAINRACLIHDTPWIETGVSESAMSGHFQIMIPGVTACYDCNPPLNVTLNIETRRDGVCAASLSSTMGIVAGLAVQTALKMLLNFGSLTQYLGYNVLQDFFDDRSIQLQPECGNPECQRAQQRNREAEISFPSFDAWALHVCPPRGPLELEAHDMETRPEDAEWVCDFEVMDEAEAGVMELSIEETFPSASADTGDHSIDELAAMLAAAQS